MDTTLIDIIAADVRAVEQVRAARAASEEMKAQASALQEEKTALQRQKTQEHIKTAVAGIDSSHEKALSDMRSRAAARIRADEELFETNKKIWIEELLKKVTVNA